MNKKGFFFTIVALLLILLFYTILQTRIEVQQSDEVIINQARIQSINIIIQQIQDDILPNLLIANTKRSLQGTFAVMNGSGSYEFYQNQTHFFQTFRAILINGSANQTHNYSEETLFTTLDEFRTLAQDVYQVNLLIEFHNNSVKLEQTDFFSVQASANFTLGVMSSIGAWQPTEVVISKNVSILDLNDPFVKIYTGRNQTIKRPIITVAGDKKLLGTTNWNRDLLNDALSNAWYREYDGAPSYLQRFYNDTTAHPFGIESLIDPVQLELDIGIADPINESYVDYLFFVPQWDCETYIGFPPGQEGDLHTIQGVDNRFRLEDDHLIRYLNVTADEEVDVSQGGLTTTECASS